MDHEGLLRRAPLPRVVPRAGWAGGAPPPDHRRREARALAGGSGGSADRTAALLGVGGGGCRAPPASRADPERGVQEKVARIRQDNELKESVNIQHDEGCQKLQDELELQKSKEEKQRALLQLQWKVIGENQQVHQAMSSNKRRDSYVRKESHLQLAGPETKQKDVNLRGVIQSPISTAMRKVEKGTQDLNHRKVTHHEYEVETANGRITKRRKTTKSTVMFGVARIRQDNELKESVNIQHEKDCQKLEDEQELQKSKEEKQRAVLQLQWKVLGENQQVHQEVSSKKRRDSYVREESQVQLAGPETKQKAITVTGTKKNEVVFSEIQSQLKNKNYTVDVKATSDLKVMTTVTINELYTPGFKGTLSIPTPYQKSAPGKVELQYLHPHARISASVGLNANPLVNFSGVVGTKAVAFGVDVAFDTASGDFTRYNAGVSHTNQDLTASLNLNNKGDTLAASYYHQVLTPSQATRTITLGTQHELEPLTSVKARFFGITSALLQHAWRPKSLITFSTEIDTKAIEKSPKFGVALALKP